MRDEEGWTARATGGRLRRKSEGAFARALIHSVFTGGTREETLHSAHTHTHINVFSQSAARRESETERKRKRAQKRRQQQYCRERRREEKLRRRELKGRGEGSCCRQTKWGRAERIIIRNNGAEHRRSINWIWISLRVSLRARHLSSLSPLFSSLPHYFASRTRVASRLGQHTHILYC